MSDPRAEYTLLDQVLSLLKVLGNDDTTKFLRADGTFAVPPGTGSGGLPGTWTKLVSGQVQITSASETLIDTVTTPAPGTVLLVALSEAGGSNARIFSGDTSQAAPTGALLWSLQALGSSTKLFARLNIGTANLSYAIYSCTP
jgi:hypothetical protein